MIVHDFPQYSASWWDARRGLPSASSADRIVTPAKGTLSASRIPYAAELIADSLGFADEDDQVDTEWTRRGTELEADARLWIEMEEHEDVEEVGLITNDDGTACCSPDGLFADRTIGLEIKVPMPKTHIEYMLKGELPQKYKPQVHFSMAVSGIRNWLFCSYHPELRPFTVLVHWDEYTETVAKGLATYINELKEMRGKVE